MPLMVLLSLACASPESPEQTCERCATDCTPTDAATCAVLADVAAKADPPDFARANLLVARSCDRGWGPGCSQQGLYAQDGRGVPADAAKALALYGRACTLGAGVGCMNAGSMFREGSGVARDPQVAATWFEKARVAYEAQCVTGDPTWCTNLGYLYEAGLMGPPDMTKATAFYRTACDRGALDGCANLAAAEIGGQGVPLDVAGGTKRVLSACEAGSMVACTIAGQGLVNGGVPADVPRGVELLERACTGGEAAACGVLGAVFGLGDVVPVDLVRADRFERRACDLGSGIACQILAEMAARAARQEAPAVQTPPPVDPGTLEQTHDRPVIDDPALRDRLQGLVDAVQSGDVAPAKRAFFPLSAYLQVKDLPDPERDWNERLLAAYERDVSALHTDTLAGTFVRLEVSDAGVRWVDPGEEYNKLGYYRVRRAKVVYEVGGAERTIPVASLISWRGQWYVVHLSSM